MTIHILPPEVATQIAAGEVIERPASVVKELVENALDAGASAITVELEQGGKRLIRVSDNGQGIAADQAELAFHRHATSKITSVHDLSRIETLGFRGEALASIASVSRISAITRASYETMGTRLQLEAGAITGHEVMGAPQGCVFTVENLFFNVPARLKFLKKESTERKHVSALISRYAMAYPDVRFRLIHEGREALQTTGSGDLRDVLIQVYGIETVNHMIPIELIPEPSTRSDLHPVEVSGYAGLPGLNRSNRSQITLFVNGRWIQDSSLTYAVVQAYHTMLMVGRYPVAVAMLAIPPEEVDVNVHPAKAEVRFRRPDVVFSGLQRAVRHALIDQAPPPRLEPGVSWGSPDWAARRERLSRVTGDRMSQLGLNVELDEPGQYGQQTAVPEEDGQQPAAKRKRSLPMLRVIGQVGATYIVAEGPHGLYLIDQHAAHERILYEQFMAERQGQAIASQELLEPITVELSPEHLALIEENADDLYAVGFQVELFGQHTAQLRALPALVAQSDPTAALMAALGDIECGEMPTEATAEEKLISRVCKQAAIKAGQVLSTTEMQALIRQLEQCRAPQTCPHGRPTMLHISADQLAREFGRLGAI
jgi:DNA mismatch repair protein MutL